jgi:catechol 2,3-dioxygenase-like lactoylglutathione lyase family enzyme
MASTLRNITFDAGDARTLAWFWAQALGWQLYFDEDPEVLVAPCYPHVGTGPQLLFVPVPEGKAAKNRVHLDLQPTDRTRDEEVARLIELGASLVEDHRNEAGTGWVYLADPEGNEFCVERSAAERGPSVPRRIELKVTDG